MSFLNVPIRRGERIRQRVPIGELSDGTAITLPVMTIGGDGSGPTLYLQAGLHGDEQTSIEILRRAMTGIDIHGLRGNLIIVPVANIPSHLTRTRGFLHEERWMIDVNRIFPGNPNGLLSERIAHILFEDFVCGADATFDLHAALDGCRMLPFSFVDPDDDNEGTLELRRTMAYAFGTGHVYHRRRGSAIGTSDMSRALKAQAALRGKPAVSAELGESRMVTSEYVPIGVRGIQNVLKALEMLPGEIEVPREQRAFSLISVVHAARGGGLRREADLGDEVVKGQRIGCVVDVFGAEVEELISPVDGFVLRIMLLGAINTGAETFWIGS